MSAEQAIALFGLMLVVVVGAAMTIAKGRRRRRASGRPRDAGAEPPSTPRSVGKARKAKRARRRH